MKTSIRRRLAAGKRRIETRLDKANCQGSDRPMLRPANIQYELAQRTRGMSHGGIGSMLLLVRKLGLADAIDRRLHLLKLHLPYHESDHVLNLAFNALCDGTCLEDLELRRNDEVYLDAVNARRIPDPTTAGDFCRRFQPHDVRTLLDIFNDMRLKVWAEQPDAFFDEARVDMDGTLVPTSGECKAGMDISYQGTWGYHPLERPPRYQVKTKPRARPPKVKERIVRERGFKNIRLTGEEVAELDYRPHACKRTYRLIVVKKYLDVTQGQSLLFHDYRYFFYLTNDRDLSATQIVLLANDRCDQENLHAQLKGAVRALHAPVDNLVSNWAYMVMTALAWNLKAWWALHLSEPEGQRGEPQRQEKHRVLRMEFKTFVNAFMRLPCQIVHTSRRLIYRLLGWNPWSGVFFRLIDRLHT